MKKNVPLQEVGRISENELCLSRANKSVRLWDHVISSWSIAAGGHTRTGLEDNIRLNRDELANSNAQLVELATSLCDKYSRPVATHTQARQLLDLN